LVFIAKEFDLDTKWFLTSFQQTITINNCWKNSRKDCSNSAQFQEERKAIAGKEKGHQDCAKFEKRMWFLILQMAL
jgi:hypothetical protein